MIWVTISVYTVSCLFALVDATHPPSSRFTLNSVEALNSTSVKIRVIVTSSHPLSTPSTSPSGTTHTKILRNESEKFVIDPRPAKSVNQSRMPFHFEVMLGRTNSGMLVDDADKVDVPTQWNRIAIHPSKIQFIQESASRGIYEFTANDLTPSTEYFIKIRDISSNVSTTGLVVKTFPPGIDASFTGCFNGNKTYKMGQQFYDGCAYKCTCREGGIIECEDRCPVYIDTIGYENCDWQPSTEDTCCTVPVCPPSQHPLGNNHSEKVSPTSTTSDSIRVADGHTEEAESDGKTEIPHEHPSPPSPSVVEPFCVSSNHDVYTVGQVWIEWTPCIARMCKCLLESNGSTRIECRGGCAAIPESALRPSSECPKPHLVEPDDPCLCPYVVCNRFLNTNPDLPHQRTSSISSNHPSPVQSVDTGRSLNAQRERQPQKLPPTHHQPQASIPRQIIAAAPAGVVVDSSSEEEMRRSSEKTTHQKSSASSHSMKQLHHHESSDSECRQVCGTIPEVALKPSSECLKPQLVQPEDPCLCPYVLCSQPPNPVIPPPSSPNAPPSAADGTRLSFLPPLSSSSSRERWKGHRPPITDSLSVDIPPQPSHRITWNHHPSPTQPGRSIDSQRDRQPKVPQSPHQIQPSSNPHPHHNHQMIVPPVTFETPQEERSHRKSSSNQTSASPHSYTKQLHQESSDSDCRQGCKKIPSDALRPSIECPKPHLIQPGDPCVCPYILCSQPSVPRYREHLPSSRNTSPWTVNASRQLTLMLISVWVSCTFVLFCK